MPSLAWVFPLVGISEADLAIADQEEPVRVARGDGANAASAVLNGALAYGCGLTGAVLAERRRPRR